MIPYYEALAVNSRINAYPYRADTALYGKPEFWAVLGAQGGRVFTSVVSHQ